MDKWFVCYMGFPSSSVKYSSPVIEESLKTLLLRRFAPHWLASYQLVCICTVGPNSNIHPAGGITTLDQNYCIKDKGLMAISNGIPIGNSDTHNLATYIRELVWRSHVRIGHLHFYQFVNVFDMWKSERCSSILIHHIASAKALHNCAVNVHPVAIIQHNYCAMATKGTLDRPHLMKVLP